MKLRPYFTMELVQKLIPKIPKNTLTLGRIKKITLYMAQSREGLGGLVRKHSRLFLYSEDVACECGEVVWCKLVSTLRV